MPTNKTTSAKQYAKFMDQVLQPVDVRAEGDQQLARIASARTLGELSDSDLLVLLQWQLSRRGISVMELEGGIIAHLQERAERPAASR